MSLANAQIQLSDLFITQDQIAGTIAVEGEVTAETNLSTRQFNFNLERFNEQIKPILTNARQYFIDRNYTQYYDATKYTTVYVTSDIHSDFRKIIQLLINAKIISYPKYYPSNVEGSNRSLINLENNMSAASVDSIYSKNIISSEWLTDMTWHVENCAVVVLGDIVDGKRGDGYEINDPNGAFEYFLHIFLHNLRIKALQKNSIVLFTFGNHDFHSVLFPNPKFASDYTSLTTKLFFDTDNDWLNTRSQCLLPFYEVIPLFYVDFETKNTGSGFLGIHAGFHNSGGQAIDVEITNTQNDINAYMLDRNKSLRDLPFEFYKFIATGSDGGLWSRLYKNPIACKVMPASTLIVVGHCQTMDDLDDNYKNISLQHQTMGANPALYENCDRGVRLEQRENETNNEFNMRKATSSRGCVTLSCSNTLAHVDVGMSSAFFSYHDKNKHKHRDAEMLLLTHDPLYRSTERFYNVISRFSESGGTIMMHSEPYHWLGGKRKTRLRRRISRRHRTSRRRRQM